MVKMTFFELLEHKLSLQNIFKLNFWTILAIFLNIAIRLLFVQCFGPPNLSFIIAFYNYLLPRGILVATFTFYLLPRGKNKLPWPSLMKTQQNTQNMWRLSELYNKCSFCCDFACKSRKILTLYVYGSDTQNEYAGG